VTALAGAESGPSDIFGNGCEHHLVDRADAVEVDDVSVLVLEQAAHYVDGSAKRIKQIRDPNDPFRELGVEITRESNG
jgi:hypothetical protein